jgi:glycosyltransferase involved in cell wall biosynthesis
MNTQELDVRTAFRSISHADILERTEHGLTVLSPSNARPCRRILFVNSYGGRKAWEKIKQGLLPAHHLWGCVELVRMGYEVALAEPLSHFSLRRRPFPHDLRLFRVARDWLRPDDLIYCGHTLLYWLPFLKNLGAVRRKMVSICYARENLDFLRTHTAVIALTPAAADHARKRGQHARVAHLGWGVDPDFFPQYPYQPEWFLSCGSTCRDFVTLCQATARCPAPAKVIAPSHAQMLTWPSHVTVTSGNYQGENISYQELHGSYYSHCIASMIVLNHDPIEYTAVGFTNLLEAMALGRPTIVTRTGALPGEIDVEKEGCGLHVPPNDPEALAEAMNALARDPARAQLMGQKGRELVARRYNLTRFSTELHQLFSSL